MIAKSNFYGLMCPVPGASGSLLSTPETANTVQARPGKSCALPCLLSIPYYYKPLFLSIGFSFWQHCQKPQFFEPKTLMIIYLGVIKTVKSGEHFFSIFFDKKKRKRPFLTKYIQGNSIFFELKSKSNSDIIYNFFLLCLLTNCSTKYLQPPFPTAGTFPQTGGTFPQASGTFPQTCGTFPQTSGTFPQASGTFPQTSGTFPQTSGTFPLTSGTFPLTSGTFPLTSGTFPPTCGNFPIEEGIFKICFLSIKKNKKI
ncbi:MAG: hypothetical protein JSV88_32395 [Candidatus Aminicenantes bacterium]|nr:MAG: hypothetical protein JSV88_32395 [Candidatus Aminicenantes bacterium]